MKINYIFDFNSELPLQSLNQNDEKMTILYPTTSDLPQTLNSVVFNKVRLKFYGKKNFR